jgi:hypothetical protein
VSNQIGRPHLSGLTIVDVPRAKFVPVHPDAAILANGMPLTGVLLGPALAAMVFAETTHDHSLKPVFHVVCLSLQSSMDRKEIPSKSPSNTTEVIDL